jgi:hypothetical protein
VASTKRKGSVDRALAYGKQKGVAKERNQPSALTPKQRKRIKQKANKHNGIKWHDWL